MTEELEVDREAIVELHRNQNLAAMEKLVSEGDLTRAQAAAVHRQFMASDTLQRLVTIDVAMLEAMLKGQVH